MHVSVQQTNAQLGLGSQSNRQVHCAPERSGLQQTGLQLQVV